MPLLDPTSLAFARCIAEVVFANPFSALRVDLEREALGAGYLEVGPAKALGDYPGLNPNTTALAARSEEVLAAVQARAAGGRAKGRAVRVSDAERELVLGVGVFALYHRYWERLDDLAEQLFASRSAKKVRVRWYASFERDVESCLRLGDERLSPRDDAPALLALFFQFARAFDQIYARIAGRTEAAVQLRAAIWESIFTCDLKRYRSSLTHRMADVPTLVTGPSGTGKELVARAVGSSGYLPFDVEQTAFEVDPGALFLPVNLAACSPGLIESELFGHRRGAFTGAQEDRISWLERCAPYGAVFLDELAETDPTLQVKLLRVLQSREFQRVGEQETRRFEGRLVSATNCDLEAEIQSGRFREDLYYRICADRIVTPPLRDLIGGDGDELEYLLGVVARGLFGVPAPRIDRAAEPPGDRAGEATSAEEDSLAFAADARCWVEAHLGLAYPWPGNFRELEQCARALLVRGEYRPQFSGLHPSLGGAVEACSLTADELLTRYCSRMYDRIGTYEGAAKRLGLDRRTVRARVQAGRGSDARA